MIYTQTVKMSAYDIVFSSSIILLLYNITDDKNGKIVGIGPQFTCESSVNPVNFFEMVPGENKAVFQMNMNGPLNDISCPASEIDRYEVVVRYPEYFY